MKRWMWRSCILAAVILKSPWRQPSASCWAPGSWVIQIGPMTPEAVIMKDLQSEAWRELAAKEGPAMPRLFDPFMEEELSDRDETLAQSILHNAMAEAGLA
jgi:hypothetical protein